MKTAKELIEIQEAAKEIAAQKSIEYSDNLCDEFMDIMIKMVSCSNASFFTTELDINSPYKTIAEMKRNHDSKYMRTMIEILKKRFGGLGYNVSTAGSRNGGTSIRITWNGWEE